MWILKIVCGIFFLAEVMCSKTKPNIIIILADDLGWSDVGFHGSEIPTPNIDALAYNGVILNSHYTQSLGTPSRSALLTGKYPIHTGMQHSVILESEPWGLSLNETLLPQHLKKKGYVTHAIGKWHLGFYKEKYTPTFRGFDTHFGYWQGHQDYYNHFVHATFTDEYGYDMRRNMTVDWDSKNKYSTELFTIEAEKLILAHNPTKPMFMYLAHLAGHAGNQDDPLQAPSEEVAKFFYIGDPKRRIYAAMVSMLDKSVGRIISALKERDMLANSIILFLSDNGAQTEGSLYVNYGSNYPFRGLKGSSWEGGTRSVATVWSPLIQKLQTVSYHLMHITDWVPTLYTAAGFNISDLGTIDGRDMWDSITEGIESSRTNFVYNIDDIDHYAAVRLGDWKYVNGTTSDGGLDGWYGSAATNKNYTYDILAVLDSDTNFALSDIVSFIQIQKSRAALKAGNRPLRYLTPIGVLSIKKLRNEATVICLEASPVDTIKCKPYESPCLFNIKKDPCETINLAFTHGAVLEALEYYLNEARKSVVPARNRPRDLSANPLFWNSTWTNWKDFEKPENENKVYWTPLVLCLLSGAIIALVIAVIFFLDYYSRRSSSENKSTITPPFKERFEKLKSGLQEKLRRSKRSDTQDTKETQPLVSPKDKTSDYEATDKPSLSDEATKADEELEHALETHERLEEHTEPQKKQTSFTKGGRKH